MASGIPLVADGALLPHEEKTPGATEVALRAVAAQLGMGADAIHRALETGKSEAFERSSLYERVFALAEQAAHRPMPRATLPHIDLHGPKITRQLTTEWYANRVNGRFEKCVND